MPRARGAVPLLRRRPPGGAHGRPRPVDVPEHRLGVRVRRGAVPPRGQTGPPQGLRRLYRRVGGFDREGRWSECLVGGSGPFLKTGDY